MQQLAEAFLTLLDPATLIAMVLGTVFGILIGAMPGLGSVLAITIALPFTFGMDKFQRSPWCWRFTARRFMAARSRQSLSIRPGRRSPPQRRWTGFP